MAQNQSDPTKIERDSFCANKAHPRNAATTIGLSMSDPILDVRALTKSYGALTVLSNVSFSLSAGSTCAIVGRSGSGKSTLLGLCAGLDYPTSGSVSLGGTDLSGLDEDQRALLRNKLVGFVFQNFQLIPTLTALENVMVPLELRRDRNARRVALDLLAEGRAGGARHSLSGGAFRRRTAAGRHRTRICQRTPKYSSQTSQPAIWTRKRASPSLR